MYMYILSFSAGGGAAIAPPPQLIEEDSSVEGRNSQNIFRLENLKTLIQSG